MTRGGLGTVLATADGSDTVNCMEEEEHKQKVAKGGWTISHSKYFPQQTQVQNQLTPPVSPDTKTRQRNYGPCYTHGFAPAFVSVQRRGSVEYRRRKQLETEDVLLRDALTPMDATTWMEDETEEELRVI